MKIIIILTLTFFSFNSYASSSKLKDLVTVKGVRENPIIGYGLVIGLNGTGDSGGEITNNSLKRMFQKLGLNPQNEVSSKNVAAVIVTSKMGAFARIGQKLDINVSSIGDAASLAGGTLLVTPLKGGDGNIYAVASGQLSIGGLKSGAKFATGATIPNGAIVEREVELNFDRKKSLRLSLKNPDFTTAARIERTLNEELGGKFAISRDATTVDLIVPMHYQRKVVQLMAIIENFDVVQDVKAKIVINERTGTIVAGGNVMLRPAAISHGDLSIQIGGEGNQAEGEGAPKRLYFMDNKAKLNDVVKALNALGASPEDLISIFQTLKRNGSLVGDIELL
ncbi:MAG: flagellar basal body P-ring protein FlgI [Bdellovibrionales bacterium]|jgi:flagellar P-ring protein precursor FlgI|nr:flagellar basal body P-ring protein FlgI [Bdellovibrionales bacterium]